MEPFTIKNKKDISELRNVWATEYDDMSNVLEKNNAISKTFCHYPFTVAFIGSGGTAIPCCISEHHRHTDKSEGNENGELILPKDSIADYWNSKSLKKVQQQLLDGKKPIGCRRCWEDEAKGMASKRIVDMEKIDGANLSELSIKDFKEKVIKKPKLLWIDLQMANLCNLACRMCTPWNSSLIEEEAREHKEEFMHNELLRRRIVDPLPQIATETLWWKDKRFVKELEELLPQLTAITVSGGEPTVNKHFNNIIDFCLKENIAKDLILKFNTNGMQINRKYMDKLTPFKYIEMKVSVDGIGSVYDYIRMHGSWKVLEKNMKLFQEYQQKDKFYINSDPTYQVLNICNLVELLQWHIDNDMYVGNLNPVHEPEYHNVSCLPNNVREYAYKKLDKFLQANKSFLVNRDARPDVQLLASMTNVLLHLEKQDNTYHEKYFPIFLEHTRIYDKLRGQKFSEGVPELYNLLEKSTL